MNVTQAAEMLGVSRQVIYRLARDKELTIVSRHPAFAKHGPVGIKVAEIEAYATKKGIALLKPRP